MLKIQNAYFKRTQTYAKLRQGKLGVSETTQMRNLNHFNDNVVTFWALYETSDEGNDVKPSSNTPIQARMPLEPVTTQLRSGPLSSLPCDAKPVSAVRISSSYASPYVPSPRESCTLDASISADTSTAHITGNVRRGAEVNSLASPAQIIGGPWMQNMPLQNTVNQQNLMGTFINNPF